MTSSSLVTHRLQGQVLGAAEVPDSPPPEPPAIPRARGVGRLLDATIDEFLRHFAPLMGVGLALGFALNLMQSAVLASRGDSLELSLLDVLVIAVTVPVQTFVNAYAFYVVGGALTGRPVAPLAACFKVLVRAPALAVVVLAVTAATVLTCGIGAFFAQWLLAPALGLLLLEDVPLGRLLPRTVDFAQGWGSFGRWLGLTLVLTVLLGSTASVELALEDPGVRGEVLARLPLDAGGLALVQMLLLSCLYGFQFALSAVALVVFYLDLCVRRGGLDLRLRLARLQRAAGERAR